VYSGAGRFGQRLAEVERSQPDQARLGVVSAGIVLELEWNLFGRLRRATKARKRTASRGCRSADLAVRLAGQWPAGYFELRGLQQQLRVSEENVSLRQASLDIVGARLEAGRGYAVFIRCRARAQLDSDPRCDSQEADGGDRRSMHRNSACWTGQPPPHGSHAFGRYRQTWPPARR